MQALPCCSTPGLVREWATLLTGTVVAEEVRPGDREVGEADEAVSWDLLGDE